MSNFEEVRSIHELLYYLDDHKTTSNYFRILKYLKSPQLYKVAKTMKDKKLGLYEVPWAYCFEKAIGVNQDLIKAVQIYYEAFEKILVLRNESKSFLYYRIGASICRAQVSNFAEIFFNLTASDLFLHLKQDPFNISLLYELSKLLIKGRGVPKKLDLAIEVLIYLKSIKPSSAVENFTILYANRKLKKLQQSDLEEIEVMSPEHKATTESKLSSDNKLGMAGKLAKLDKERLGGVTTEKPMETGVIRVTVQENLQAVIKILKGDSAKRLDAINRLKIDPIAELSHEAEMEGTKRMTIGTISNDSLGSLKDEELLTRKTPQDPPKLSSQYDSPLKLHTNIQANPTPSTFSKIRKKSGIQKDPVVLERILTLLEHHKKKSYTLISQQLQISDKARILLSFLKSASEEQPVEEKEQDELKEISLVKDEEISDNVVTAIQDIFSLIASENRIRVFKKDEFTTFQEPILNRTLATYNQNGQLFELQILTFPLKDIIKIIPDNPCLFFLPSYFLHPQFFPIYGMSFINDDTKLEIVYYLEPRKTTFISHLSMQSPNTGLLNKISLTLQILYLMYSFHMLEIPLLTLSPANLAITSDGEVKLFDLFLAIFENPSNVGIDNDTSMRIYKGPLENLSPDIFRTNGRMSTASDIYCFGFILYEILTGKKLYTFDDFQDENDFCDKIKNGLARQKLSELKEQHIQLPGLLENLLLGCLSFHKKKRPTIEQLIFGLQNLHQMMSNPQLQQNHRIAMDNVNRHSFELPYNLQGALDRQCRALHFSAGIDEDNFSCLLPGSFVYKGQTNRKIPHGEGELSILNDTKFQGKFQKGILHGDVKIEFIAKKEIFSGTFSEGYPIRGQIKSYGQAEETDVSSFESRCWIPKEEYRLKMIKGFEPVSINFLESVKVRRERLSEDDINFNVIAKYVQLLSATDFSRQKKANSVDCFGNFFFLIVGSSSSVKKISSYIVRSSSFVDSSVKIYSSSIKENYLFQADLSSLNLYHLKGKSIEVMKYPIITNFEEMVRYFHLGHRCLGRLENGILRKGIIHSNYSNYFWYEAPMKFYQGANFVKAKNCLYVGNILKNKAEGFGTEFIGRLKRYEGEYEKGNPHGRGVIYNDKGEVEFSGILCDGKPRYGLYSEGRRLYNGKFAILQNSSKENEDSRKEYSKDDKNLTSPWNLDPDLHFNANSMFVIPTEIHKQRPDVKLMSCIYNEEPTRSEDNLEETFVRTEFQGVVYNFSENVKEIKGKFIMEDKKFNGHFKVQYTDGSFYDGNLRNGARYGHGTLRMNNGSLFTGFWDRGSLKGKIIWGHASKVLEYSEGEFTREKNGQTRHNNFGRLKFKNGDLYEGEISNGFMEGYGTFYFRDGKMYEGMIKNNKPEGIGKFWICKKDKGSYYEGELLEGKKEGYGILYVNNEVFFRGKFEGDKPVFGRLLVDAKAATEDRISIHEIAEKDDKTNYLGWYIGYVKEIEDHKIMFDKWGKHLLSSMIIEAEYEEGGFKENYAKVEYRESGKEAIFLGEMKNKIPHGLGRKLYSDTNDEYFVESYEGEWENGIRKGIGKFLYREGNEGYLYKGQTDQNKEGVGEWKIDEQTTYRGEFCNNIREGRGLLTKGGRMIVGMYKDGKAQQIYYGK